MIPLLAAFSRPFSDWRRYTILAILWITPLNLLAFPWIIGYLIDCIGHSSRDEKGLPEWTGFWRIAGQGLGFAMCLVVFLLPGYLLLLLGTPGAYPLPDAGSREIALFGGYALLLIGSLLGSSSLIGVAVHQTVNACLNLRENIKRIFAIDFLVAWAIGLILSVGLTIGSNMIIEAYGTTLPRLGGISIIAAIITAYVSIANMTLLGESEKAAASVGKIVRKRR